MPRIKTKEQRKMLKLHSLSELSKVVPVDAFAEPKLEVPAGAFEDVPSRRKGEHAAYVRYNRNEKSGDYATFVFVGSCVKRHFPKAKQGDRFELVQGKPPHKNWFMLRPAATKRGNKMISAGVVMHTRDYIRPEKLDKDLFYPLQLVPKDGVLYAVLHPDLVPLLR
jgi:hypothetical protein